MTRKVWVVIVFTLLSFFVSIMSNKSFARIGVKRDQTLFLAAANAIADGKQVQAKILLKTLIYTYPDSPLVGQAKFLVFYSDAHEVDQRTEEPRGILKQIEDYLNTHHPKPQDP